MNTTNKNSENKPWWYYTVGLNEEHRATYKEVKAMMSDAMGREPSNLDIMFGLMKFYIEKHKD